MYVFRHQLMPQATNQIQMPQTTGSPEEQKPIGGTTVDVPRDLHDSNVFQGCVSGTLDPTIAMFQTISTLGN